MSEWQISLVFEDGNSHKFWRIRAKDTDIESNYGRVGSKGQFKTKSFDSASAAEKDIEKQANAKRKKGYVDVLAEKPPEKTEKVKEAPPVTELSLEMKVGKRLVKVQLKCAKNQLQTLATERYPSDDDAAQAFQQIQQALLNDGYEISKG